MTTRISTGIPGLDDVLEGGLLPTRGYLVRGPPGVGKTLVGLHFLQAGIDAGDDCLFINMGAPEADVRSDADAFGFDLSGVEFLDLSPASEFFVESQGYDIFSASDVAGDSFTEIIAEAVAEFDPDRVFVDPLTQFRYLTPDTYQFREQVLAFLQFLKEQEATVLFTSQDTAEAPDDDLQFMSDGNLHLKTAEGGRTLEVTKFRGSAYRSGEHSVRIDDDGMAVYPVLRPGDYSAEFDLDQLSSGNDGIDSLLAGGIERGSVTLLSGPTGVGKTTLGAHFIEAAAARGERSVIYLFEEAERTFRHRCESLSIPVGEMVEDGRLTIETVESGVYSPDELAHRIRTEVETEGTDIVMLDGLTGYRTALRGEETELSRGLHSLCHYLRNMGVATLLTAEVHDVTGTFRVSDEHISYLADTVVFIRYLEMAGEMRKAIGVLKKRASDFERTLREFDITDTGIEVGDPLVNLRGILSGTPEWVGEGPPNGQE